MSPDTAPPGACASEGGMGCSFQAAGEARLGWGAGHCRASPWSPRVGLGQCRSPDFSSASLCCLGSLVSSPSLHLWELGLSAPYWEDALQGQDSDAGIEGLVLTCSSGTEELWDSVSL